MQENLETNLKANFKNNKNEKQKYLKTIKKIWKEKTFKLETENQKQVKNKNNRKSEKGD